MFALNVSFDNPFTFRQYDAVYGISAIAGIHYYSGYELFESIGHEKEIPSSFEKEQRFIRPKAEYPAAVHGLLLAHDQNHFEEIAAQHGLVIENLSSLKEANYSQYAYPFDAKLPTIMGIINATPDSFSDGGKNYEKEAALKSAAEMVELGIDILDVGGESTRPGSERISTDEELSRVIPVITAIRSEFPLVKISVDTYKSKVAEEACLAGADIINDISGGVFDEGIMDVAGRLQKAFIIMHTYADPKVMQNNPSYKNLILEIALFLQKQAARAQSCGVQECIIDPGIGFGKSINQNYEILSRLQELRQIGYPILIGLSRKSFIGKSLELDVNERDSASAILSFFSLLRGASIIRVHNVAFGKQIKALYKFLSGFHG